jgi:tRNA A-37 threonylcarbamoyl transferase component Bud32/membrane protein YdbS with pleckstrin-like domain
MPSFDFVLSARYRLIGPLGEGGMATVYRGRDLRLNREVAVKILREDLTRDPTFLHRFRQEAQFVASLSHPNIVPVYDVGEEDGTHFIVMEYVRGRTLHEALDAGGPMSPDRASAVALQVLDALAYAHAQGIIHRDVKPHNILLTPDGTARLADFGIAHLADGSTTRTAAILGSAQYLSPEQSRGEEASERSDIYASGIVLYEMLAGAPPFDGPNALAIANQHLNATPPRLRDHVAVHPALEAAVMRALAKSPDDRFDGAAQFADTLRHSFSTGAQTTVQPLAVATETTILPLVVKPGREETTEEHALELARSGARPARIEIRRSARKIYMIGFLCAIVIGAIAYALDRPPALHRLPHYPSAYYGLVPAALLVLLAIGWMNTRSWLYTMDNNAAVVQWGLIGHHRFGVPIRFITTLELKQSAIDRILGVGMVQMTARDQHGEERQIILEDLAHPRDVYEELMEQLSRVSRPRSS